MTDLPYAADAEFPLSIEELSVSFTLSKYYFSDFRHY